MADLRASLTRIYSEKGELTPQSVVDDARPPASELHGRFEWNDEIAGEAYRRSQAAELIRSVRIEFVHEQTGERRQVRAFSSVREAGDAQGSGYRPTEEVMADPLASKILLRQCEREIADLKTKYGHLAEFGDLVQRELVAQ